MLEANPRIAGRDLAVGRAEAGRAAARSRLLPQLTTAANVSWNRLDQATTDARTRASTDVTSSYEGSRASLQARQALLDLPAWYRLQGARAGIEQATREAEVVRMALAAELVEACLDELHAEEQLAALAAERELSATEAKRAERMRALKLVKITDVYEIAAYRQSLETKTLETGDTRQGALDHLHALAGTPVEALAMRRDVRLPAVPGTMERWVADAREHHPALLALDSAVVAAGQGVREAKAQHLPQLSLQASHVFADNGGYDNRQLDPYQVSSVGVQLNLPIYAGGGIDAGVNEAVAKREIAAQQQLEKAIEIERNVRSAFRAAQTGLARVDSTAREVEAREKARDGQQKSYELGAATVVDALAAKRDLLAARLAHSAARYDYLRALVALRLWTGSLSREHVAEIGRWLGAE
ncbi:MAG: TolC family protein [Gammaproteobacteria bacterium]|nr:TolC family protein [Gammaproteobacteria bacterium]MBI5616029.1 TolC family protein [Gammaproteobacteria bacterium]